MALEQTYIYTLGVGHAHTHVHVQCTVHYGGCSIPLRRLYIYYIDIYEVIQLLLLNTLGRVI